MIDTSFDFDLWLQWRETLHWFIIILGFFTSLRAYAYNYNSKDRTSLLTISIMIALLVLLGFYPIEWGYSTDRANYANVFVQIKHFDNSDIYTTDFGFLILNKFFGLFLNVQQFFVAITFIYLANYYIAIHKFAGRKSIWLVVGVVVSLGFTNYALNTMRAGLALSFLLLGLAMYPNKWKMLICGLIGTSIHNSAAIPSLMIAICYFVSNTKLFYKFWFLSIPLSFAAGSYFMGLFANIIDDNRVHYLSNTTMTQYNIGFRIDFILYSLAPIIVGGYYIIKKQFDDRIYSLIYNAFLLTNIFWILVIRANYSDRFAYLSWFLIPFVLIYPLLKQKLNLKENIWLGSIILGETLFQIFF